MSLTENTQSERKQKISKEDAEEIVQEILLFIAIVTVGVGFYMIKPPWGFIAGGVLYVFVNMFMRILEIYFARVYTGSKSTPSSKK